MKKYTFETLIKNENGYVKKTVNGYKLELGKDIKSDNPIINEREFAAYKKIAESKFDIEKWYVIELETGLSAASGDTRKEAINDFNKQLNKHDYSRFKEVINNKIEWIKNTEIRKEAI